MKILIKCFVFSSVLLASAWLFTAISEKNFELDLVLEMLPILLGGSLFLSLFSYILETYAFNWLSKSVGKKIKEIFQAKEVDERLYTFQVKGIEVKADLQYKINLFSDQSEMELINFYIKPEDVDSFRSSLFLKAKESSCRGIPAYKIYGTNRWGLKLAKKRINKSIHI
ncbi:MAG: hypothetical protein AAF696_20665 [Bacteroidota bacterium]